MNIETEAMNADFDAAEFALNQRTRDRELAERLVALRKAAGTDEPETPVARAYRDLMHQVDADEIEVLVTQLHERGYVIVEGLLDGKPFAVKFADRTEGYLFRHRGVALRALVCTPQVADLHSRLPEKEKPDTSKLVISPMPGLVVSMDVEVGMDVEEGGAVCIVEAMKVFNEIKAGQSGTVAKVLIENGDAVEFGQPMLLIKPA